jgi:hypothetical protein
VLSFPAMADTAQEKQGKGYCAIIGKIPAEVLDELPDGTVVEIPEGTRMIIRDDKQLVLRVDHFIDLPETTQQELVVTLLRFLNKHCED